MIRKTSSKMMCRPTLVNDFGDAYVYLMRLFATESGTSKGQFYTPVEVSRIMAKIIGIRDC
jgi:type I restriction-modification system DNA methylase subunit